MANDVLYDVEISIRGISIINAKKLSEDQARSVYREIMDNYEDDQEIYSTFEEVLKNFGFMSASRNDHSIQVNAYRPYIKGEKQTCPERMSGGGPWDREENLDTWDKVGDDRVCSFCGSIHPDDLLNLVKEKGLGVIEGSTKSYKWYLRRPEVRNAGFGAIKFYKWHATEKFINKFTQLVKNRDKDEKEDEENKTQI